MTPFQCIDCGKDVAEITFYRPQLSLVSVSAGFVCGDCMRVRYLIRDTFPDMFVEGEHTIILNNGKHTSRALEVYKGGLHEHFRGKN